MKKFLILILLCVSIVSQGSITNGKYYLQNVASGNYLSCGGLYGTQTVVDDIGFEIFIENSSGNSYYLNIVYSGEGDGLTTWINPGSKQIWQLHEVADNTVIIGSSIGNLTEIDGYIVKPTNETGSSTQWRLISYEARLKTLSNATPQNPVDASFLINERNYFSDLDGKESSWIGIPNVWQGEKGQMIEIFNGGDDYYAPYNMYQNCMVKNGLYKLTVQGFYRSRYSYKMIYEGYPDVLDAILYANDKEQPLRSIHSETQKPEGFEDYEYHGGTLGVPRSAEESIDFYKCGLYLNSIDNIEVTDGILTVGLKQDVTIRHGCWMQCYNFRLYYYGNPNPSEQTLNLTEIPEQTYGTADYMLPANTDQGQTLIWTVANTDVATVSGNMLTIKKAGTTTVTATQAGNTDYNAFTKEFALTVNKAALTITADNANKTYGETNPIFTVTYSGFVNGDDETKLTTQPTISTTATVKSTVGTYPVTVSGAASDNYDISYVSGVLTVNKAMLTIIANNCTKKEGEVNPALTVSYEGFVYDDDITSLTKLPTVTTTATTNSPVGTYVVIASGAEADNYDFTYVDGTLTVTERPAVLEPTDISQMDNAIYIEPFKARIGENVQMNIKLKNAEAATAYVFDLVLPEGITVALNDKGKYIDELSDRHDDHTRTFNYKGNNTYSLSTLSGNSEELTGNDGTIRLLTLSIADNVAEGIYTIEIKNASYSKPDGTLVTLSNTITSVTVEDYVLGDVNGNGSVDIGDAVSIVNYLVGKTSQNFVEKAADTNRNSQIDIGDAVTIVNYLVGKTESLSRSVTIWDEKEPQ